jgi:hypothetical protein
LVIPGGGPEDLFSLFIVVFPLCIGMIVRQGTIWRQLHQEES